MADERLERLKTLNAGLAESLRKLAEGALPDIPRLTGQITQGGMLLDEARGDTNPAWQAQVAEYHQNLMKLKVAAEKLQSRLSGRRDQLRAGGEQLRSFSNWIDALKNIR